MTPPSSQSNSRATQKIHFQWRAMVRTAALEPGWQDHLTSQLFAVATVPVAGRGPILPNILQAQVMGQMERLYKVRMREGAVDVRVSYEALAHMHLSEPPPCELLIKTTAGGQGVTIDPPTPPSPEEWQDIVRQFWAQLQMDPQLRLDWGTVPPHPGQSGIFLPQRMLVSRFRLAPELLWENRPQQVLPGRRPATWQRELRLVRDVAQPWLLHAQVGWRDPDEEQETVLSHPLPHEAPDEAPEAGQEPETLPWKQGAMLPPAAGDMPGSPGLAGRRTLPPLAPPSSNWQDLLRRRGGLLIAGALLLAFILLGASVLAFGVMGNTPQTGPAVPTATQAAPTSATGDQASPTSPPSALSTSTAGPNASPTPKATKTPTATATSGLVVNWSVATAGTTSQHCSPPHPNVSALTLTINNSKSSVALTWQVTITDTDPAGKVWASASPTSGTIPAGQQAQVTITPISSLCADMAGAQNPITYRAVVSGSAAGQSQQVTISVSIKP